MPALRRRPLMLPLLGLALAACASAPKIDPAVVVDHAGDVLNQAQRNHVDDYDAPDLRQARGKYAAAQAALQAGQVEQAKRLAKEAELCTRLASVQARLARAKANKLRIQRQVDHMETVAGDRS